MAEIGQTSQFIALGTFANAQVMDLTASATWSSSNTPIATIDNRGLATGVSCGNTTVTAQFQPAVGQAVVGQTLLTVDCTIPNRVQLVIVKTGPVGGLVVSSPAGINCGITCDTLFDEGTGVTLTATQTPGGSTFKSWVGCDQVSGNVCALTVIPDPTCSTTSGLCRIVTANY